MPEPDNGGILFGNSKSEACLEFTFLFKIHLCDTCSVISIDQVQAITGLGYSKEIDWHR
jgi:hypothetical protein